MTTENANSTKEASSLHSLVSSLRAERSDLVRRYNRLPRKDSFSGWALADKIEDVERRLGDAEWKAANAPLQRLAGEDHSTTPKPD